MVEWIVVIAPAKYKAPGRVLPKMHAHKVKLYTPDCQALQYWVRGRMRKTFIINLTRFGDLIQTQPVLSGYKAQGDQVCLVCLETFAAAAELLADVDMIIPLPGARLLAGLDQDWSSALQAFWAFGAHAGTQGDAIRVVNLTPSLSGRLLGHFLLGDGGQIGFGLDSHGFGLYSSPWANFLQAASRLRGCSPFNLVDVLVRVGHLQNRGIQPKLKLPDTEACVWSADLLKAEGPQGCCGYVAFQLGASQDMRRWPAEFFAHLGDHLWTKHRLCPVVVGTEGERPLGEKYGQHTNAPWVNLLGRTRLDRLGAVLTSTRLLVTNDTGTMHMAAGLDIPIVAIFLATAQPWDTGPYRGDCVCLEPDMPCHPCSFGASCPREHACRQSIKAETVAGLLDGYFEQGRWEMSSGNGVRAWKSVIRSGLMDLTSLTGGVSDRTSWIRIQRWYYRQFLDECPPTLLQEAYPLTPKTREEICSTLRQCAALVHLFREQGGLLVRMPGTVVRKKFMATWQRIQTNFEQSQWFGILGLLWMYQTQDNEALDLKDLFALLERYDELVRALIAYVDSEKTA